MTRKKVIIISIGLLILTGLSIGAYWYFSNKNKPVKKVSFEFEKPENIEKRIPKIIQRCKVRQNLMQLSNDAKVIKNYIQPQFDHYFWRNDLDENYLQDAIKFYES